MVRPDGRWDEGRRAYMGCRGRSHSEPVARSTTRVAGTSARAVNSCIHLGACSSRARSSRCSGASRMGLYGTRSFDASRSAGQIRGAGDGGRSGPGPNQFRLRGRVQGLAVEPGLADARVIRALRTQIERVVLGRIAQGGGARRGRGSESRIGAGARPALLAGQEDGRDAAGEACCAESVVCEPPACARAAGSSPATPPGRGGGAYFRAHV